jgi:uncharacterized membrane protein YdfJ with MMPL/SSD domain
MGGAFARLGALVSAHHRAILVASTVLALVGLAIASGTTDALHQGGFDDPGSEAGRAEQVLAEQLSRPSVPDLLVLIDTGGPPITDVQPYVDHYQFTAKLGAAPAVDQVFSFLTFGDERFLSDDGTGAFMFASLAGSDSERREGYTSDVAPLLVSDAFEVQTGGTVPAAVELTDEIESDLQRAELLTLPITLVLLLVVFGGVAAAVLPLVAGVLGIIGALAALRLIAGVTDISVFALTIVTMLGLSLAIDYSLFIVNRYREEMGANGDDVPRAVRDTVGSAGRSVAFSGATTALSLASMLFFRETFFRSLAIGGVAAVLIAALVAIVVLPALITLLGLEARREQSEGWRRRVRWPLRRAALSFDRFDRRPAQLAPRGFWYRVASIAQRQPVLVATACVVVLVALSLPFLRATLRLPDERQLPPGFESRETIESLDERFSQLDSTPVQVVLSFDEPRALDRYTDIVAYGERLEAVPGVEHVESIGDVPEDRANGIERGSFGIEGSELLNVTDLRASLARLISGNVTVVSASLTADPQSPEARSVLDAIREVPLPVGASALYGGETARLDDSIATLKSKAPLVAGYILVVIFVALFLQFRSLLIPLKAVLMNLATVTTSLGVLVLIFQDGHLQSLLGFEDVGFLTTLVPVMVFSIVFGLSIDYEIFLLSRIREEYDRGSDTSTAVVFGLQRSGRIITGAAAVVIVVVGAFATSDLVIMKQLGVGLAVAIFIDVTLVRALLVPSAMQLMRDGNWWAPDVLKRLVPGAVGES